jgi:hypothetical protein
MQEGNMPIVGKLDENSISTTQEKTGNVDKQAAFLTPQIHSNTS